MKKYLIVFLKILLIMIGVCLFLILLLLGGMYLFDAHMGSMPEDQVINKEKNICLVSTWNCGSGTFFYTININCHKGQKIQVIGGLCSFFTDGIDTSPIDALVAPECSSIYYDDFDDDGIKEIMTKESKICLWLRWPENLKTTKKVFYDIDDEGHFIERK